MPMQIQHIAFHDIRSRVLGADVYPFRPRAKIGPRLPYAHTFIYIKSGRGMLTIGQSEHRAEPHDLFYIEPGTVHSFAADSQDPMVHASVYVDLLWSTTPKLKGDKRLNEYRFEAYDPELSVDKVRFTTPPTLVFPAKIVVPAQAEWLDAYLSVIREFESVEATAPIRLRSLFEAFLTGFVHFLAHPFEPNDPRIRTIITWMQTHLTDVFRPAEWAATLNLSEAYVYELFRKETGDSPQQYFMRCRLEQAKTELRETNLSVTHIAEKLGFASVHYFSRQFSAHMDESPNQYRRRIRETSYTAT
ncbi:AraC family transcriptional regulator [Paenibacillus cremeus]|nr:AraC family transcriptional regulator [Paenibacillus cremeus]